MRGGKGGISTSTSGAGGGGGGGLVHLLAPSVTAPPYSALVDGGTAGSNAIPVTANPRSGGGGGGASFGDGGDGATGNGSGATGQSGYLAVSQVEPTGRLL